MVGYGGIVFLFCFCHIELELSVKNLMEAFKRKLEKKGTSLPTQVEFQNKILLGSVNQWDFEAKVSKNNTVFTEKIFMWNSVPVGVLYFRCQLMSKVKQ